MRLSFNEWTVSGEIFYLKELDGEFSASVMIRGIAKRQGVFSSNVMEMKCIMQKKVYEISKKKGLRLYCNATLSGHLETWVYGNNKKKVMFIVDDVIEVEKEATK